MLMRADDGAVDHRVFVVGLTGQVLNNPFPHPGLCPAAEPPVGVFPVAETLRKLTPGDAGTVAIKNRFDEAAVVLGGDADMTGSARQQIVDALPLVLAQSVPVMASACSKADSP